MGHGVSDRVCAQPKTDPTESGFEKSHQLSTSGVTGQTDQTLTGGGRVGPSRRSEKTVRKFEKTIRKP